MTSRLRRYLRAPRKLSFSRDGRWFVGITLLIGIGAINTGNNLLYLLLGMMLGLIIVSGILSEQVLRKVTVRRLPHGDLFAGELSRLSYEVENGKRVLASLSIEVRESESDETRARRRVAMGLPAEPPERRKDRDKENDVGGPKALALRVPPGSAAIVTGEYRFPIRGLYRYLGVDLGTRFPFGLFYKVRPIEEPREVLVYPAIREEEARRLLRDLRLGEVERHAEGRSGDFFGLREFREGDDRRDVHWKATARRGQLVRRLYERNENDSLAVHLYNHIGQGLSGEAERRARREMEEAIVRTASICAMAAREGIRFSLVTLDERVQEGSGAGHLLVALRHLALLEIRRDREAPALELSATANRVLVASPGVPPEVAARFDRVLAPDREEARAA